MSQTPKSQTGFQKNSPDNKTRSGIVDSPRTPVNSDDLMAGIPSRVKPRNRVPRTICVAQPRRRPAGVSAPHPGRRGTGSNDRREAHGSRAITEDGSTMAPESSDRIGIGHCARAHDTIPSAKTISGVQGGKAFASPKSSSSTRGHGSTGQQARHSGRN
jgi:hypothetical protein